VIDIVAVICDADSMICDVGEQKLFYALSRVNYRDANVWN